MATPEETTAPPAPPPTTLGGLLATLLTTPTLLVLIGGGIATAVPAAWKEYVAWQKGVASSQLAFIQAQELLWEKNVACLSQGSQWELDGPHGVVVSVTVCTQSGDLLVRYKVGGEQTTYQWVALPPAEKLQPYHGR